VPATNTSCLSTKKFDLILCQTCAAIRHAIVGGGYHTSFGSHIFGEVAGQEASRVAPAPVGTLAKLGTEATDLVALILQV